MVTFAIDRNVLKLDWDNVFTILYIYQKPSNYIPTLYGFHRRSPSIKLLKVKSQRPDCTSPNRYH